MFQRFKKICSNTPQLPTSTRITGPGVPQWANSRSRKNKIRPQAKEISAMIRLEKTKEAGGWALKPKWQTPLPPRVSRKRSGHSICSEADGNSSRSPETLSIELPTQIVSNFWKICTHRVFDSEGTEVAPHLQSRSHSNSSDDFLSFFVSKEKTPSG